MIPPQPRTNSVRCTSIKQSARSDGEFFGLAIGFHGSAAGCTAAVRGFVLCMAAGAGLEAADLTSAGGLEPEVNGVRERASLPCCGLDGEMADKAGRHINTVQLESSVHIEASGIEALRFEPHLQVIAAMQWPQEVCFAMHHRQCCIRPIALTSAPRKDASGCDAVTVETFFPGFVAPAKQLMEMHHAGGVGVAKAHATLKLEPIVGGGHGCGNTRRQNKTGKPSMPANPSPSLLARCRNQPEITVLGGLDEISLLTQLEQQETKKVSDQPIP